jgi:nickel-type superoxide dismutase maturation protease
MRRLLGTDADGYGISDSDPERRYPTAGLEEENTVTSGRVAVRAIAAAAGAVAGAIALRVVRRVEVTGASMRPTLEPGDRLLVLAGRRLRDGDLVAVADPRQPARTLVKRVGRVDEAVLTVLGDAPAPPPDSRNFGPVPRRTVLGRAVYRYAPSGRAGPIRRGVRPTRH